MARPQEYDERIVIEKARDLFWRKGYAATSIQELERATGLNRSSLYNAFGGKQALYDRTLAAYQEENLTRLRRELGTAGGTDAKESLRRLFRGAIATARGCFIVNCATELAQQRLDSLNFVADNRERFVAILEDFLARTREQGKFPGDLDTHQTANFLFLTYNGLQVMVQTGIPAAELTAAVDLAIDNLPWR